MSLEQPIGKIGDIWKHDDPTLPKLSQEDYQEAWNQAMENVRNQEPLQRVYDSSDYAQGIEQGRLLERMRIRLAIEQEIKRVSEPMLVDREYLDGLNAAYNLTQAYKG